jgi:hypothetical protein
VRLGFIGVIGVMVPGFALMPVYLAIWQPISDELYEQLVKAFKQDV